MDGNREKSDLPLNYFPPPKPLKLRKGWERFAQELIPAMLSELSAFWSFFWRWLLLYTPIWALLMLLYLNLTHSG